MDVEQDESLGFENRVEKKRWGKATRKDEE
jgi:hypothetical protein